MSERLAEELRRLRQVRRATLRAVEEVTGLSNAYVSQLENDKAKEPSPHVLYKLAQFYNVPYEHLMELAGYVTRDKKKHAGAKAAPMGSLQALLMSAQLDEDEEKKVTEFIEFLRSQKKTRGP